MKTIEGTWVAPDAKIAIIISRFNHFINQNLLIGAIDALTRNGNVETDNISTIWVPGAYELPLGARIAAKTGNYDGIIALGSVIRGATAHFDYVAGNTSTGLMNVSLEFSLPVGFGVLTTDTIEQAIERAGSKAGNKGAETALVVLEMLNLLAVIQEKS